jgi:hypothetical protein
MAKYTFKFQAEAGLSLMKGYKFNTNLPGDGAIKQYIGGQVMKAALKEKNPQVEPNMSVGLKDWYSRPVFSDVILRYGNDSVEFMNALITVDQAKHIVRTSIAGRNGQVIEYVGLNNYTIKLSGNILGKVYPKEQIKTLIDLIKLPYTVDIFSEYLEMFGIFSVVVTNYTMPQVEANESLQQLSITFESDETMQLIVE